MFAIKLFLYVVLGFSIVGFVSWYTNTQVSYHDTLSFRQMEDNDAVPQQLKQEHFTRNHAYVGGLMAYVALGIMLFLGDIHRYMKKNLLIALVLAMIVTTGCSRKPFEPIVLESISTSEEGFLIPLRGDKTKQVSTNSEEDLRKNLVTVKQVQIPQQWISKGYENVAWNGEWKPAAVLIKVDRAPVTREWTADTASVRS